MRQLKISKQITSRETLSLQKYLNEVGSFPLLSKEEEEELPKKIQADDEIALKRFVEGNLRFVISVAKQYQGSGEKLDDLINSGNFGLITAAKRFDTSRGFKFISYAVWWIRQSIMQHLTENAKGIRLPSNKVNIVNKIKNITSSLEQELQRSPTTEEIGDELLRKDVKNNLKLDSSEVDRILAASSPISSLDMVMGEDSSLTLMDYIVSDGVGDVNVTITNQDLQVTIRRILSKRLSVREREVIIMSFGLFGEPSRTLEEIGEKFDLTRERVRQIREKALRRLKHMNSTGVIREYL